MHRERRTLQPRHPLWFTDRPTPPNERASPLRHLGKHRAAHMRLGPENLHHYLDVNVKVCGRLN